MKRLIPILTIGRHGLIKTVRFKKRKYVGDLVNAVQIFNKKYVDELFIIDIDASRYNTDINFNLLEEAAGECFSPMTYGGGIKTIEDAKKLFRIGFEKICIQTAFYKRPEFIGELVDIFGAQSVIASIDYSSDIIRKNRVRKSSAGFKPPNNKLIDCCLFAQQLGVGEILINNKRLDGTFSGMDIETIAEVSRAVNVPVTACGGLESLEEFATICKSTDVSGIAAGSFFIFQRPHHAVLITYPSQEFLAKAHN